MLKTHMKKVDEKHDDIELLVSALYTGKNVEMKIKMTMSLIRRNTSLIIFVNLMLMAELIDVRRSRCTMLFVFNAMYVFMESPLLSPSSISLNDLIY